jgi:hypothetical protein
MRRIALFVLFVVLLPLLLAGCGDQRESEPTPAVPLPSSDFPADVADPVGMCVDSTTLPGNWKSDGDGLLDNQTLTEMAPEPARKAEDLRAWGRVTGAYRLWVFVTATQPLTKEQSRSLPPATVEAIEAQSRRELLAAPYVSVECVVATFEQSSGAQLAYEADVAATGAAFSPQDKPDVMAVPDPIVADASTLVVVQRPSYVHSAVVLRLRNVVASVTLTKPCGLPEAVACDEAGRSLRAGTEHLATAQRDTIERAFSNGTP